MSRTVKNKNCTAAEINALIRALCEKYDFLERFSAGKSVAGRDIPAVRFLRGESYTLFAAAFHGSEHITSNISLMFLEELAAAYANKGSLEGINVRKAFEGRGTIFVPRVNPDGCEISISGAAAAGERAGEITKLCGGDHTHWNANIRGVDINHNFDADFADVKRRECEAGIYTAGPSRFGGTRPESEPETAALVRICKNENIHHVCALHTQGEVIFWRWGECEPEDARRIGAFIQISFNNYACCKCRIICTIVLNFGKQ